MKIDVLAIGETMAMVAPLLAESVENAQLFRVEAGGAESNVACQLAAAGRTAAWFGAVGDDALGRRVLRFLVDRGVDVSLAQRDPGAPTGLYVKDPGAGVSYYRRGSAAAGLDPASAGHLPWDRIRLVHLSAITLALSPNAQRLVMSVMAAAHSRGVQVSFDVNYRPALWPSSAEAGAATLTAARKADIVWAGLDEARMLWEIDDAGAVRELLPAAKHLIIKDADIDATEFTGDERVVVPTPRVDVVEAVGAGDAFAAGWLDAWFDGEPASGRLTRGHAFAARVLSSTSDVPAPRTDERTPA